MGVRTQKQLKKQAVATLDELSEDRLKVALDFLEYLKVREEWEATREVMAALEDLQHTPFLGKDIKKLRGDLAGKYRLRIGRVRAVYSVFEEEGIVRVDDLGHP